MSDILADLSELNTSLDQLISAYNKQKETISSFATQIAELQAKLLEASGRPEISLEDLEKLRAELEAKSEENVVLITEQRATDEQIDTLIAKVKSAIPTEEVATPVE